jgi:hypothetical protein
VDKLADLEQTIMHAVDRDKASLQQVAHTVGFHHNYFIELTDLKL